MVLYPTVNQNIPPIDLLSWLFLDGDRTDLQKSIYIDALDDARSLSRGQVVSLTRKIVAGLKSVGLKPSDAVCIHAFNHILYSTIYLGIIGAGGSVVGSNPGYATLELEHLLQTTRSRFIIVEADLLDNALPAISAANIPASHIFLFTPDDNPIAPIGLRTWDYLLQHGEQDWIHFSDEETARTTVAALFLTSGTTGLPKAAMISHYAHVAAGVAVEHLERKKTYDVSYLITLPQFHAFAAPLAQIAALRPGRTTYIMRRFELDRFTRTIQRFNITDTAIVPHIVANLINSGKSASRLSSLRSVYCAGSPLPEVLGRGLSQLLSRDAVVSQNWGMTEIGWITMFPWPEKDVSGSAGKLVPNIQAKFVDENKNEILDEEVYGELYVRGPSIMNGYLENPSASLNAVDNDWLRTGDIGYFKSGKIYVVARKKDLMKVRGWQVSPSELECTLLLHPCIADVAVVGVQLSNAEGGGDLPRAYVVIRPGCRLSKCEVKTFVGSRMARFKALDGGVAFVNAIPRNASGKIMRKVLADRARAEIDAEGEQ